jgi:sugar/nucleoside kinase (ribokinase family)
MPNDAHRVVVFGDVIDDIIATPVGEIRSDTDTPSSIERRAGGSAANMASWLAAAGASVDFVGRVGVLDLERHSASLRAAGVRPMLAADHVLPTGAIVIIVSGDRRTMLTERGANAALDPEAVSNAILEGASVVHFTGYSLFGRDDTDGFHRLIKRAKARGVQVSVDAGSSGFLADFGPDKFLHAVAGASVLFPNLDEGRVLTGLDDPEAVATRLASSFPVVALTLGVDGVIVVESGGSPLHVEATRASTVDPTGAGDAFCAGFLNEWVESHDSRAAAQAGSRLAARAVGVVGGRPTT